MEAGKLVLVWRGSLVVASETFDEVSHVYLTTEPLDGPRASVEAHRMRFEASRVEADRRRSAVAAGRAGRCTNDDAEGRRAAVDAEAAGATEAARHGRGARAPRQEVGAPPAVLEALDQGDAEGAQAAAAAASGQSADAF